MENEAAGGPAAGAANRGMNPKQLLVVQTAFIGDVVLLEPLIAAVRARFPACEIDVVVRPEAAVLLETHPAVRQVIVYDKRGTEKGAAGFWRLRRALQHRNYDVALVPHRSLRSALLVTLARIPLTVGFARGPGRFLFTQRLPYLNSHEVTRNLSLLQPLGIRENYRQPAVYPATAARERARHLLADCAPAKIALAPGSVWPTKQWPEENFAALGGSLLAKAAGSVILLGGRAEQRLCERLAMALGKKAISLAGKLNLLEAAAVLRHCDVLVCNDSAPTHLGVAAGCAVVTIYGPTIPGFGFYPRGGAHRIVEPPRALACRPCSNHGGKRCPIGTFACMKSIAVAHVEAAVLACLKQVKT